VQVVALLLGAPELAEEGEEQQAEHVERRQERGEDADAPHHFAMLIHVTQDFIFREKARERWNTSDGQAANKHGEERDRHGLTQAAHAAHVLLVAHAVDDRTGT
nr:hypothetical protein [Tanacetum cinerariifolium]